MSALTRFVKPNPLKAGFVDPVTEEATKEAWREGKRWTGGRRSEAPIPYAGPPMTGEGMTRGSVAPLGRRSTVISGNTRRTSLLGG